MTGAKRWVMGLLTALLLLMGCAVEANRPSPVAPTTSIAPASAMEPVSGDDACAERMHDLSGLLLLHFMRQGDLPLNLRDLGPALPGMPVPAFVCPVSERPYVYNPVGIYLPERRAHLVLHDPAPSHGGFRWCIVAEEGGDDGPIAFKVIALPESFFVLHPAQASGT